MKRKFFLCIFSLIGLVLYSQEAGAQWHKISNNFDGIVECFAESGTNLFAGSNGGGVFLSTDNGSTWKSINPGLQNKHVHSLLTYQTALLAGTDGGIFLSTNTGNSWFALNAGLGDTAHVNALLLKGDILFAGTSYGVFRSTLSSNWERIDTGFTEHYYISKLITSDTNLLAGTYVFGVWRSVDNGSYWDQSNTFMTKSDIHSFAQHDTDLFAATDGPRLFLSNDNGHTWPTGMNFPADTLNSLVFSGSDLFAGSNKGVSRTTDKGVNWTDVTTGMINPDVRFLAVTNSFMFAATSDSGLWRRPLSEVTHGSGVSPNTIKINGIECYPNPPTSKVTIKFSNTSRGNSRIIIINILGEEVIKLFTGELEAGEHSFQWNTLEMRQGAYFCLIQIDGKILREKIILSK